MEELLQKLKSNPKVYYIYEDDISIYGLESSNKTYLVIIDNDYNLEENENLHIYKIQDWFKKIENCDIICWECACLNKKFIIKEYVKLLMSTDLLKLRKNIENTSVTFDPENLWSAYKNIVFTNQIIINHKIVNFSAANSAYSSIISVASNPQQMADVWDSFYAEEKKFLNKQTDGLWQSYLKQQILKKLENESRE